MQCCRSPERDQGLGQLLVEAARADRLWEGCSVLRLLSNRKKKIKNESSKSIYKALCRSAAFPITWGCVEGSRFVLQVLKGGLEIIMAKHLILPAWERKGEELTGRSCLFFTR